MISRRTMLELSGAAGLSTVVSKAYAASYPDRTVRLIVPVPPGGALDIIGRIMAQWLTDRLGQTVIVENKPGAATNIGVEYVTRAIPDGYTLLLEPGSVALNPSLYAKLPFDVARDIAPIALISKLPLVFEINLGVPARTLPEFLTWAKANRGKINLATAGVGTTQHIAGVLLCQMSGIEMTPVPFAGGGPALVALMGEQVQAMFSPIPESMGPITSGQARAIAVTTPQRLPMLPDVPTIAETLPGFEASTFQGIGAPAGTPHDIVERLNKEINAALADPTINKRLLELGGIPTPGSSDDFGKHIVAETTKWGKVIRDAKIVVE